MFSVGHYHPPGVFQLRGDIEFGGMGVCPALEAPDNGDLVRTTELGIVN